MSDSTDCPTRLSPPVASGRLVPGLKMACAYLAPMLLSLLIVAEVLDLWEADLRVPFNYTGDSLFGQLWFKSVVDHGWYLRNPMLGAPGELEMHDFPLSEGLHFLIVKFLALFTSNSGLLYNLYYLLTYPLTVASALFVLRRLGVSYAAAVAVALLFAFLPYHYLRGQAHLFLASYYLVPLSVLVVLWMYLGRLRLFVRGRPEDVAQLKTPRSRIWGSVLICLLHSSAGVYYAFFACYLLLVAAVAAFLRERRPHLLATAALLIAVTTAGVLLNVAPNIAYLVKHGPNREVAARSPIEAEIYALKIAQLVMPIRDHRIELFSLLRDRYERLSVSNNENRAASLGLIGSAGFLLLLAQLLRLRPVGSQPGLWDGLAMLNIAAVLLATMGGLGSVFNHVVTPQIRCYNRISVYIGFLALVAVALVLQRLAERMAVSRRAQLAFGGLLAVGVYLGVLDQSARHYALSYGPLREATYQSDAEFVARIEQMLPAGAAVYQLPYVPFPEGQQVCNLEHYGHLRPFLHSRTLRWSYGAMKGRRIDAWQKTVSLNSLEDHLTVLSLAGFSGVYVDRAGFADRGSRLETELAQLLQQDPLVSPDLTKSFFDISSFRQKLEAEYSPSDWQRGQQAVLTPINLTWSSGFSFFEGTPEHNWRWCESEGELILENPSAESRPVRLEMTCDTGYPEPANLRISGPLFSADLVIDCHGKPLSRTLVVPPGRHAIRFSCDARRVDWAPNDPRTLVFRVYNLQLRNVYQNVARRP